ncbi:archaea-specific SMC-related protein [Salinirubellus salinus]
MVGDKGNSPIMSNNVTVDVRNIGGIEETSVEFSPGVTILVGRNATNRTSLLQAVMAGLGSDDVSMKADADEGGVDITVDGTTYTQELYRRSQSVVTDGEPYLEDATLADLFAFLLESNEARRTVARGDDLRELIMRPVDTESIEAEISRLVDERKELEAELEEIESLKGKLPGLEEERTRLESKITETQEELEAKEAELEAADADVEETREEEAELEDRLAELREKRSTLDDVRYDLETERESLEALEAERRELESEYEELPETPAGEIAELDTEIGRLRDRKQRLETEVNELQNVIGFNEEMLNGAADEVFEALGTADTDGGQITDQLLADDTVSCWTCGSEVDAEQIERTVDQLRKLSQQHLSEVNDIDTEIADLQQERTELQQSQRDRERIERRLEGIEEEVERSESSVERLQERRAELTETIEQVEAEVDEMESDSYGEVLDLHKEANQLEYELGRHENDLERVEENIASLERRIETESEVERKREELSDEIADLRTRIERIEQEAVEQFNEHMDTILGLLHYDNIDRIWIERVEREVREGRRKVTRNAFELHVVRSTASGTVYEDTVSNLSESEREVTGLVFALAGYLAHEVHESVPFILLDSLEAIDSERIATLVDYFAEFADYLLVALLPEDASALPAEYERLTEI